MFFSTFYTYIVQVVISVGFVKMQKRCKQHPCIYRRLCFPSLGRRSTEAYWFGVGGVVWLGFFCTLYLLCLSRSYPNRDEAGRVLLDYWTQPLAEFIAVSQATTSYLLHKMTDWWVCCSKCGLRSLLDVLRFQKFSFCNFYRISFSFINQQITK